MFSVALVGPDGVGKTTIAKRLETSLQIPIRYIYMGMNYEAANYMLPTSRWWQTYQGKLSKLDHTAQDNKKDQKNNKKTCRRTKFLHMSKSILGLVNLILEEWYRQIVAYVHMIGKKIVIFDRHFIYDFRTLDAQLPRKKLSLRQKLHLFFLENLYIEPDLVICLDAPTEVVFERKAEFPLEEIKLKRRQYLSLQSFVNNFAIVNANQDLELVVANVSDIIHHFYQNRVIFEQK